MLRGYTHLMSFDAQFENDVLSNLQCLTHGHIEQMDDTTLIETIIIFVEELTLRDGVS